MSCSTNTTQSLWPVYSWTLHCNYLPLVVQHENFTTSLVGLRFTWPASNCSEPSVWTKWSILHAPCEIHQNSDHKWPAMNPACTSCQTPLVCWNHSSTLILNLSVIHWKTPNIGQRTLLRKIHSLLVWNTEGWFQIWWGKWGHGGNKLIHQEQGFPQQTPGRTEVLQREGANC